MAQKPTCPNCGSNDVHEMADARVSMLIKGIDDSGEDRDLGEITPTGGVYDADRTWRCDDCGTEDEDFSKLI